MEEIQTRRAEQAPLYLRLVRPVDGCTLPSQIHFSLRTDMFYSISLYYVHVCFLSVG